MGAVRLLATLLAALLLVAGCSGGDGDDPAAGATRTSAPAASESPSPTASTPSASPTPAPSPPPPPNPVSIQALVQTAYAGSGLVLGDVLAHTDAYVKHAVTYRSNGLTISGTLDLPTGPGPFPALVLAHGYIDPAVYTTGRGMRREQEYLARAGYVVLHVDYRNHAASDPDPAAEERLRLGYTEDVIGAVLALREAAGAGALPVDGARIGLMGRSMGGGVVYNALVAQPGLVDAAVVYAPVSSNTADNFDRWTRDGRPEIAARIAELHGLPETNPTFWAEASPRTYFDRVTEPLLVQHGTADESCPYEWSVATVGALQAAGKSVELVTWEGEAHAFGPAWPASMERTVAFFRTHLR
jgi:dipeptidyl aminopeptidase/acylaminoacyl peptidase